MSAIDVVILLVLVVSTVVGLYKGAIRQIGSIAGVVIGFIGARLFGDQVGAELFHNPAAQGTAMSPIMEKLMGCIVVFLVLWVVVFLVVRFVKGIISAIGLSIIDRIGGAVIMIVKCFLLMSIVLNVWYYFNPEAAVFHSSNLMEGRVMGHIFDIFPYVMGLAGIDTGFPAGVN